MRSEITKNCTISDKPTIKIIHTYTGEVTLVLDEKEVLNQKYVLVHDVNENSVKLTWMNFHRYNPHVIFASMTQEDWAETKEEIISMFKKQPHIAAV